jgi:predicted nucleotidyltransferase
MSVNTHLTGLASALVLADTEKSSITTSISTLASRLDSYFGSDITSHILFGSYPRGTILPRKADNNSDIDYMVVFSTTRDGQKKPQTYLDRLKRFAEAKYSTSDISQSSPTIVLSLNHINFELVPAIDDYGFKIPSPASSWSEWTSTDPTAFNKALQEKNVAENYQIKPLVRLVKYWNARKNYPFTSYSLEQYIINKSFYSCSALRDYFYTFWDGLSCTNETAQYIKDMVATTKQYAKNAINYETIGQASTAEDEIKKIVPSL